MCKGKGMNVLVMDVEGTDGRERGEDQVRPTAYTFTALPLKSAPSRISSANLLSSHSPLRKSSL